MAVLTFAAGYAGLRIQDRLTEHNSVDKARDMIGAVLGLLSLLLALVLGTLIGNTYYFSTGQQSQLQNMMSTLILLDRSLADYGPEARPLRHGLKGGLNGIYQAVWVKRDIQPEKMSAAATLDSMKPLEIGLGSLDPKTPEQKAAQNAAFAKYTQFMQTRILMALQLAAPFSKPLLGVVIVWSAVLFFGYGMLSKHNWTTMAALAFGSISVAIAIFIIIELGEPYSGVFRISPSAVEQAIEAIDR